MSARTPPAPSCVHATDYDPWTSQRATPDHSLYVSNLPPGASVGNLCAAFEGVAKVAGAEVHPSGGHGYVHFHNQEELKKALNGPPLACKDAAGAAVPLSVSAVVEPLNVLRVRDLKPDQCTTSEALAAKVEEWAGVAPTKVTLMYTAKGKPNGTAHVHFADNEAAGTAYTVMQRSVPDLSVDFAPMRDLQNRLILRRMEQCCHQTLKHLGEDPERDGLKETPSRWAKALLYLTKGYDENLEELMNGAIFDEKHHELVLVKDIEIHSMCEHHMLPFFGKVHIAYIPKGKVLGLSKLARIAEMYARRLQVQERLTRQIAYAIERTIHPLGVAVVIDCSHMCMVMRGVQKVGASTVTSSVLGEFERNPSTRAELFSLIGLAKAKL